MYSHTKSKGGGRMVAVASLSPTQRILKEMSVHSLEGPEGTSILVPIKKVTISAMLKKHSK